MVSNFDRIYAEITRESGRVAADHDVEAHILVELVMAIVDLEDQHLAKRTNVSKQVADLIENVARYRMKDEEV